MLEPLRRAPLLQIHCVPGDVMTTFALEYTGAERRLRLRRRARPLTRDDVPPAWAQPRVAYVGPVVGECDGELVRGLAPRSSALGSKDGCAGWRPTVDKRLVS